MAKRNLVGWVYTDGNGKDYVRRADAIFTAQAAKLGGATAVGSGVTETFPRNYRPRAAKVYSADDSLGAWVVVYDQASLDAMVINTTTVDFRDGGGTTHTGTVKAKRGERLGRMIGD